MARMILAAIPGLLWATGCITPPPERVAAFEDWFFEHVGSDLRGVPHPVGKAALAGGGVPHYLAYRYGVDVSAMAAMHDPPDDTDGENQNEWMTRLEQRHVAVSEREAGAIRRSVMMAEVMEPGRWPVADAEGKPVGLAGMKKPAAPAPTPEAPAIKPEAKPEGEPADDPAKADGKPADGKDQKKPEPRKPAPPPEQPKPSEF